MNLISHYTSAKTAIDFILPSKSLRFNELKNTNDPWEYKKEIYIKLEENFLNVFKFLKDKDELDKHFQNLKSISFTNDFKDENKRCFYNQLMWTHYSKNHQGVCLVFDKDELVNLIKEQYEEEDFIEPRSVEYDDSFKKIVLNNSINTNNIIEHLSYRKKMIWKYEEEFRCIIQPNDKESFIKCIERALKAIIIGGNFPKIYHCKIKELIKNEEYESRLCKINYDKSGSYFLSDIDDEYLPSKI